MKERRPTTPDEALRAYVAASAVRDEYARPWHALAPQEMGECFVTGMRSIGWVSPDELREAVAKAKEGGK